MVAITYGKGVIVCEPYENLCGKYFSDFIDRQFDTMFEMADKGGWSHLDSRWRSFPKFC